MHLHMMQMICQIPLLKHLLNITRKVRRIVVVASSPLVKRSSCLVAASIFGLLQAAMLLLPLCARLLSETSASKLAASRRPPQSQSSIHGSSAKKNAIRAGFPVRLDLEASVTNSAMHAGGVSGGGGGYGKKDPLEVRPLLTHKLDLKGNSEQRVAGQGSR